jgi:hypothetical protein
MTHSGNWRRWTFVVPVFLGVLGLMAAGCEDPGPYGQVESISFGRVVVHASATEPSMDNTLDPIWNDAKTTAIFASDSAFANGDTLIDSLPIYIKAIKTSEYLYLRVKWGEDVYVSNRSYSVWPNAMVYHITVVSETDTSRYWTRQGKQIIYTDTLHVDSVIYWHDQDRFAVMWNMGDNGSQAADCRSMCHAPADTTPSGDRMYTTGGGHADVWQWEAGTTDPVLLAQDEFWSADGRGVDAFAQPIYDVNFDTLLSLPLSMNAEESQRFKPFLHLDDAVPFDSAYSWKNLDSIPGYVVNDNASGSIADVKALSSYSLMNASWMVLMRRQLTTGNLDDLDLGAVDPGDSVMVTMAFMNNSNSVEHGTRPFYIILPK